LKIFIIIILFTCSFFAVAESRENKVQLFIDSNKKKFRCRSSQVVGFLAKEYFSKPLDWEITVFQQELIFDIYSKNKDSYFVVLNEKDNPSFFAEIIYQDFQYIGSSSHRSFYLANTLSKKSIYFSASNIKADTTSKLKWLAHGSCVRYAA